MRPYWFLGVVCLAGCAKPDPGPPPAGAAPGPAAGLPADRPAPHQPWQDQYAMPTEVEPAAVAFAAPTTGDQFRTADRAARRAAGDGWAVRAGGAYPYVGWNGGTGGYRQEYAATWARAAGPARPNHTIVLSTELYHEPRQADGFALRAAWEPAGGWGAAVYFRSYDGRVGFVESFSLTLTHPEHLPDGPGGAGRPALVLGPDQARFSAARADDRYTYEAVVSSRPAGAGGPLYRPQADAIRRYWSSAASFRDVALEELGRLGENARAEIASGRAFKVETKGGPTGRDVPRPAPEVRVPPAVREAVLKEALAEVEARRALVLAHYEGMHAAAVAAFPELPEVGRPTPAKK